MQIKRPTSWSGQFGREEYDLEPVHKRTRCQLKSTEDRKMDIKIWGFDELQSGHVMRMVSSELQAKLQDLEKQVLDLEKAKSLREAEFYDTRKEYVEQFVNFWKTQEADLTFKILDLRQGVVQWTEELEIIGRSSYDYDSAAVVNSYRQNAANLLEQSDRLQGALDFVKNDQGSLQEALENIGSLSIDSSRDQQNMDLLYLRRMYPRRL